MLPATIVLTAARLPHDMSPALALALLPALAVVTRPLARRPAGGAALFVALHAAGLAYVSGWLVRYLELYRGWCRPLAWAGVVAVAVAVAAGRYAVLRLLAPVWRAGSVGRRALAIAGVAAADLGAARLFPWYETVGVLSSCAEFPGAAALTQWVGFDGATTLVIGAALAFATPDRWLRRAAPACGLLASHMVSGTGPDAPVGAAVRIVGVQRPDADGDDVEIDAPAAIPTVAVLPEGACLDGCRSPLRGHRVAGVRQRAAGERRVHNVVIVESEDGETRSEIGRHTKQRLAPWEGARVLAAPELEETPVLAGIPLALPICYEIFDRELVARMRGNLGISVSRDSFDASGSASAYMSRAAWLRALEFRMPFIRVSDTVASAAYNASGSRLAVLPRGAHVLDVVVRVQSDARIEPWRVCGGGLFAVWGALLAVVIRERRRSPR